MERLFFLSVFSNFRVFLKLEVIIWKTRNVKGSEKKFLNDLKVNLWEKMESFYVNI